MRISLSSSWLTLQLEELIPKIPHARNFQHYFTLLWKISLVGELHPHLGWSLVMPSPAGLGSLSVFSGFFKNYWFMESQIYKISKFQIYRIKKRPGRSSSPRLFDWVLSLPWNQIPHLLVVWILPEMVNPLSCGAEPLSVKGFFLVLSPYFSGFLKIQEIQKMRVLSGINKSLPAGMSCLVWDVHGSTSMHWDWIN